MGISEVSTLHLSSSHPLVDCIPVKTLVCGDPEGRNFTVASHSIDRERMKTQILGYFSNRHDAAGVASSAGIIGRARPGAISFFDSVEFAMTR